MFAFLRNKRLRGESATPVGPPSVTPSSSAQHHDTRRELVRVVLKDSLRLHGVPFGWLACEVIIIARPPGDDNVHVQLVLMKWNEQLLRYACALQQQLLLGLDRFDPSVDHSKYIFSWRFSPDCGCPLASMPDPKFWRQSAVIAVQETPVSVLDRRHTRRAPVASELDPGSSTPANEPSNFAPTQMSPLI